MSKRDAQTITATLYGADRLNNSVNGNPRWSLRTSEGELITQSDAGIGYEVNNHLGRPEHSAASWVGREVVFTTTRAGRVWDWALACPSYHCRPHRDAPHAAVATA